MTEKDILLKIDFKKLTIASLIFGFLLIPIHEFGHVVCDWITGHPASMSYARDYLLAGGETPFLGLLGGPLLPLIVSAIAVVLIYNRVAPSVFYPPAILGTVDRLALYTGGVLPSDEKDLARLAGWNNYAFKYIFLSVEILLLVFILFSCIRYKLGIRQSVSIFIIPVVSFIISAFIGVFIVERYVFPNQFMIQFH